jgi:hypothetical protein
MMRVMWELPPPIALVQLQQNVNGDNVQNYDVSSMRLGGDVNKNDIIDEPNQEGAQDDYYESSPAVLWYVWHMTMERVVHFDILWSQHRLVWPSRTVNHYTTQLDF